MKTQTLAKTVKGITLATAMALFLVACSEQPVTVNKGMKAGGSSNTNATTIPAAETVGVTYKQIERLARPAINEGLVITNDYLNAFNSIPPTADLSDAAAPVLAEAGAVLTAVHNYGVSAGLPAPQVGDVVSGFLPDVMRVDTSLNIGVGTWAYNADFVILEGTSGGAMLTAGRKIEDDVMDITLSYLIAGNPVCGPNQSCAIQDGVSYAAGTTCTNAGQGSNPSNPGHKCLKGQVARNGSATFPFLPSPN